MDNQEHLLTATYIRNHGQDQGLWSKLFDVQWGFNNVHIKDGNQWKVAFKTNLGVYEPMVMFFGLCNSTLTFQAIMNDTLKYEIKEGFCIIHG